MHFVIGGANNGKRQWVKDKVTAAGVLTDNIEYRKSVTCALPGNTIQALVWTDLEQWIEQCCGQGLSEAVILEQWEEELTNLVDWELSSSHKRQVVIIATDQSKGIVPIERMTRMVRDISGWCHQITTKRSSRVTRIWYGLAEDLKNEEEDA